jgi:hypothetical protein
MSIKLIGWNGCADGAALLKQTEKISVRIALTNHADIKDRPNPIRRGVKV